MKVAIIHSYYSSEQPSGENIVVDAQVEALRRNGIQVRLIAQRTDDLRRKRTYGVRTARNVAFGTGPSPIESLNSFKPDVVHIHNLFPNWGTHWLKDWPGTIVTTLHNFRPICAAGTLYRDGKLCDLCLSKGTFNSVRHACYHSSRLASVPLAIRNAGGASKDAVLARANRIIVLSERARQVYLESGVPDSKLVVIPNFVEDGGLASETSSTNEWVYIGRLAEEKGILRLVENWPQSHRLKIFGDGPLREKITMACRSKAEVEYLGPVPREQVSSILGNSIGLVFPSEWAEGFPTVYAEALAAGRPVVARRGNSAADDILESGAGLVYDSFLGLDSSLNQVEDSAFSFGKVARERFEGRFTLPVWMNALLEVYESEVHSRKCR